MELMHKMPKLLIFIFLLFTVGCNGCEDDDGIGVPMGEECIGSGCMGVALCNNGYCECPDTTQQLASGFCLQGNEGVATFVTYDVHEGILDTTIITLVEEPFTLTWQEGDPTFRQAPGKTYNRHPDAITIGQQSSVMTFKWPGDFTTPVDSVFIYDIYDKSNNQYFYRSGEWICRSKHFAGKFIDQDHIVGEVYLTLCETDGNTSRPVEIQETTSYPVTYTRLR